MNTVREMWETFALEVIPLDAPSIQRREMRRSFYAGVFVMLQEMKVIGDSGTEEEGCARLDAIEAELRDFQRLVLAGRA
jgi:hypothetical protein